MIERFLIVGFGSIGKRHARIVRKIFPNSKIILLRHKKCDELSQKNIDYCVTKLNDAIKLRPQVAIIANPATYHVNIALPLAKLGVHLLIEKPISNSTKGVIKLIDICKLNKTILMVGYNLRYLTTLRMFQEILKKNLIGKIISVRSEVGSYLPLWRAGSDYKKSVSAKKEFGGGVLLELSHDINYLIWIFGKVKWVSSIVTKQSNLKINTEDTAFVVLGFSSKGTKKDTMVSLNMDFTRHDSTRYCKVIGEFGTLYWNAIDGSIKVFYEGTTRWETLFKKKIKRDDTYVDQLKHFIDCIENKKDPISNGEDGLETIKVIEAIKKSSNSSSKISLI